MTTTDPGVDLDDGFFDLDDSPIPPEPIRRRRPGGPRRPQPRRPRYRVPEQPTPPNFYPDVAAFVAGFLAPTFAREWHDQDTERRWCSHWWLHTEAIVRLEALWKAWETLRLDPGTGASTWLLHHADPAMAALTSPTGTFRRCKPDQRKAYDALPTDPPPPGLFSPRP